MSVSNLKDARYEPAHPGAMRRVAHPDQGLDPAVQIAVHHVRAADPHLVARLRILPWLRVKVRTSFRPCPNP